MQADNLASPEVDGLMCYCCGCTLAATANSSDNLAKNQGSSEQHHFAQKQSDFQHAMGTLIPVLLAFLDPLCWFGQEGSHTTLCVPRFSSVSAS
jgi:hypothetical protein